MDSGWIADTFEISVSTSTIKRYIGRYGSEGHIQAKVQQYKRPTIRDEQLGELVKQLGTHPDATLEQHIKLHQAMGRAKRAMGQCQHDVAGH